MVREVRRRDTELRESREQLQAILDNAPAVIYLKDTEGRYLLVNRRFETSFRVRREEVLGKTAHEIFPLEMAEAYRADDRRVLEADTARELEELAPQDDGVHTYLSVKFPLRDASGGVAALCGISTDITDRKRAEEALRKYADEIGDLYDNAPCGYHSLDENGIFVRVNETELAWLGYSREELIGKKKITDLLTAQSLEIFVRGQQPFRQTGLVRDVEVELIRKDGSVLPVSLSATAVRDGEGNLRGSRTTLFDVTERRRVDQELADLNAQLGRRVSELAALNQELEAFSYSVSHDLRSPLRHIAGFAQLLEKNASASLDEKSRRFLTTIVDAARRMGGLIDDLLVFSRMGRSEMRMTRVALSPLVKEIRAELAGEAAGRDVVWSVNGLPEVQGDPSLLRQVLMNLMSNALKYSSTREKAEIEIGWRPGPDGETVVFVRDNGVGFDMKYADKLFGVFQRLHRAEEFEGTGIGLANVRRIVQRHGGRTWAEGAVDRGATFYFSLPLSQEN